MVGLAMLLAGSPALAEPFSFDNDCGNLSWFAQCNSGSKTNWNPERFPGPDDDVSTGTFAVRAGSGGGAGDIDIKSLNAPGGLTVGSVDMQLHATSAVNSLDWTDTVISSTQASAAGAGLVVLGNSIWRNNGTLRGSGASATFSNTGNLETVGVGILERATFANSGEINQRGELRLHPNALARNQATWALNNGTLRPFDNADPPGALFDNDGILRGAGGASTVNIEMVSDAPGPIDSAAGTLTINRRAFLGGALTVAEGARLVLQAPAQGQTFRQQVAVSGRGQLFITGGPGLQHRIEGRLSNELAKATGFVQLTNVDFDITAEGLLSNSGNLRWGGASTFAGRVGGPGAFVNELAGVLTIGAADARLAGTLTNKGVVVQNETLRIDLDDATGDVAVINEVAGIWQLNSTSILSQGAGTPRHIRNLGEFEAPAESLRSLIAVRFDQAGEGKLTVLGDAIVGLQGGGVWSSSGPLVVSSEVELSAPSSAMPRTYTVTAEASLRSGPIGGVGTVEVLENATLRLEATLTSRVMLVLDGGAVAGPEPLETQLPLIAKRGRLGMAGGALPLRNVSRVEIEGSIPFNGVLTNVTELLLRPGSRLALEAASTIENRGSTECLGDNTIDGSGTILNTGTWMRGGLAGQHIPGTTTIQVAFDNRGSVWVLDGVLNLNGGVAQVDGTRLTGGRWTVDANGTLRIAGASIETIGPGAIIEVNGTTPGAFERVRRVEGNATIFAGFRAMAAFTVAPGGTVATSTRTTPRAERGATAGGADPSPLPPTIVFELDGDLFTNEGSVIPGEAGGIAAFVIDGEYDQRASGRLALDFAADAYEQLVVSGHAALDGSLEVSFVDGYVPAAEDAFVVVSAGSLSGRFANAVDRLYTDAGAFDVAYTGTEVVLSGFDEGAVPPTPTATPSVECSGDCSGDGRVTVDEILTLVNIALGNVRIDMCPPGDAPPFDNRITVDEILAAVNRALAGCL